MPYKRIGRQVYHQKNGVWKLKQTATSIPKAKATVRLLEGFERGWRPKGLARASPSPRHRVSSMGGRASRGRRRR